MQGQLNQLFTSDSTWNRLVSFNIEQVRRNKSEIHEDLTDVRTLFSQQALGNLKSLQEIRFTTGTEHPFPIDSGTQFEKLTQITVETTDYRVYNVFNQMADLVDECFHRCAHFVLFVFLIHGIIVAQRDID